MAASSSSSEPPNSTRRCPCSMNCWVSEKGPGTLSRFVQPPHYRRQSMKKNPLKVLALMLGAAGLATTAAHAQDKVKIGFITDMSSLYADVEGKNGAVAIQMAIDDFGGKVLGMPIELMSADHQNKADIAASKAREWIDTQGLTM